MKVLVTSTPGLGHVLPLLSLAIEVRDRGHQVRWVVGIDSADVVMGAGFEATVAGMPEGERMVEFARRHPDLLDHPPLERRALAFTTLFGELALPAMLDPVAQVVESWQPDAVLHDAAELAGPLVAAMHGLPSICHGFGEITPEPVMRRAGEQVAPVWASAGVAPDPYAGSYRGLYLDIYPAGLRGLDMDHVSAVQPLRPANGSPASGGLVYVTFGTLFNRVDVGFRAAVVAAAAVADEVLVTVGPAGSPETFGDLPANVTVERFVPQAEVLPRCAAVVCHGGSGTVLASLAHGLPLLCLPRGADQFANAVNVNRVGAGIGFVEGDPPEAELRAALDQLVHGRGHRAAARVLAAEIASMPDGPTVARAVEDFVLDPR